MAGKSSYDLHRLIVNPAQVRSPWGRKQPLGLHGAVGSTVLQKTRFVCTVYVDVGVRPRESGIARTGRRIPKKDESLVMYRTSRIATENVNSTLTWQSNRPEDAEAMTIMEFTGG